MYISDLHIHSHYSRATSKELTPERLELWAGKKGIHLLGTGDFTHPAWREELAQKLDPAQEGLYTLKKEYLLPSPMRERISPRFVISGEISSIYKKNGRVRKVHSLILLPSLEAAEVLSKRLEAIGNLHSDGRPILGLDCRDLLDITLEACPEAIYVPAHIWTPHFSLFGAFSGFDSIEECYEDLTPHIHALETGLSSDPAMNRRLSALDDYHLISNSDAHSPSKLGREANLFDIDMSYSGLYGAIQHGKGLCGTIEFFPEEGKYHFDGHRKCHLCLSPSQAEAYGGICPVCGKKLTTGVLHRVEQLADRREPYTPPKNRPYENLIPLNEVIAAAMGSSPASVKVSRQYEHMLEELGNEFYILRQAPLSDIKDIGGTLTAEGIRHLREGKVDWKPGYDGEYGSMRLFLMDELENVEGQLSLFSEELKLEHGELKEENQKKEREAREAFEKTGLSASAPAQAQDLPCSCTSRSQLDPDQEKAASCISPATAVIAGPGSGKTKTLVSRILHLIKDRGVKPSEITAVTFTHQAASQLRKRLGDALENKRSLNQIQIGTFHSLSMKLLTKAGQEPILAEEMQKSQWAQEVIEDLNLTCSPKQFLSALSLLKAEMSPDSLDSKKAPYFRGIADPVSFKEGAARYQALLHKAGLMDFDDLLLYTLRLLKEEKGVQYRKQHFSYLLIDEFQDIDPVQYELVKAWNKGGRELFVIGDPDQSIYSFRGSGSHFFDRLKEDFPDLSTVRLTSCYRCTPEILAGALPLISCNPGGKRSLTSVLPSSVPIRLITGGSSMEEAVFITKEISRIVGGIDMLEAHSQSGRQRNRPQGFSDIAVLYRTNYQAHLLEQCLKKEGIPYVAAGQKEELDAPAVQASNAFFDALLELDQKGSSPRLSEAVSLCQRHLSGSLDFQELKELFLPRIKKDKPWKFLKDWISLIPPKQAHGLDKLLSMSYFHKSMEELLYTITFGQDCDIQFSGQLSRPSDAVTLMTLHASKGLEFPIVFLYGMKKGLLPLNPEDKGTDTEEERRLVYVGMTRAEKELILTTSGEPSPFLKEIPSSAIQAEPASQAEEHPKQMSLFDFL